MFFSFFTWSTCLRRITSWRERILRAKKFEEVLCRQRQTRAKVPEQKKVGSFFRKHRRVFLSMTSANDEFMILMVGLSTHFSDEMMTLTKFGMHCKKGNLGDRILMQLSFELLSCY